MQSVTHVLCAVTVYATLHRNVTLAIQSVTPSPDHGNRALILRRSAAVKLLDAGTFGAVFMFVAVVVRKVSNNVATFDKARLNLELVFCIASKLP